MGAKEGIACPAVSSGEKLTKQYDITVDNPRTRE
jgi:hypothetical protein